MTQHASARARHLAAAFLAAFATVSAFGACGGHVADTEEAAAPHAAHTGWSYSGSHGPKHWASLDTAYKLCADSNNQSPINIDSTAKPVDAENIEFHYQPSKINIVNNGHTIEVEYEPGSYVTLVGVRYDLVQFHFHMPGEHRTKGKLRDGELHLVHKSADGHLLVIGVILYHTTLDNAAFTSVWENMPKTAGEMQHLDAQTNANLFLPARRTTYRYDGSLTTPPCTEGVLWNVMTDSVGMSAGQMLDFMHIVGDNYRPVQPLGGRPLLVDRTP